MYYIIVVTKRDLQRGLCDHRIIFACFLPRPTNIVTAVSLQTRCSSYMRTLDWTPNLHFRDCQNWRHVDLCGKAYLQVYRLADEIVGYSEVAAGYVSTVSVHMFTSLRLPVCLHHRHLRNTSCIGKDELWDG